jgi:hypothetical protein
VKAKTRKALIKASTREENNDLLNLIVVWGCGACALIGVAMIIAALVFINEFLVIASLPNVLQLIMLALVILMLPLLFGALVIAALYIKL